jgi:hypothetical protein
MTSEEFGWEVRNLPIGAGGTATRILGHGLGNPVVEGYLDVTSAGGQVPSGTASFMIVPEHRLAIAVATNVSGARYVRLLATRLADTFIP